MNEKRPRRVLFAIGDADWKYTRGKIRHLVERVAADERFEVSVATHAEEICGSFTGANVQSHYLPEQRMRLLPSHAIAMTDLMIRLTRGVVLPGSRLPLWKIMAMDDYLGSLDVVFHPSLPIEPAAVICPLMGVDNNTAATSHLYASMLLEAAKVQAPILGLEVSPLGNKQTLSPSLADYYGVKGEFSRSFVIKQELAPAPKTFVLPQTESYLLTCRNDPYLDDYLSEEKRLRERLGVDREQVTIFIPHNVAFIFETRQILRSLRALRFPFSVILRVDPNIARMGLKEREIARRAYREEIGSLPHVIIDEEGGWLWSLLLSDVVMSPACSVFTELASLYGKLTVICRGWEESSWQGDNLFFEPRPERAMNAVRAWVEKRIMARKSVGDILSCMLGMDQESEWKGAECGA